MKPLPKALALGAVVALVITAGNFALGLMPKKPVEAAAPAVEVTAVPSEASVPVAPAGAPVAVPQPAPQPVVQQPVAPTPAPANDAGLSNLLK